MGIEGLSFQKPDESTRKILEIMKASAQRGANIVRQILNFARGMEGSRGELQLKHVLRETEQIIRSTFPRSILLRAEFPRDLWTVVGDSTQLHQVLMNLCVNARDAMPDGGELVLSATNVRLDQTYVRMHVEARPTSYVVLTVRDTGTGMPAAVQEKIFDPFFTTKPPEKGTGLGLPTVRSIVKSHGGFVTVYSEPGRGSTFKVYLPAAEQEGVEAGEAVSEGVPMGNGELVLVVDDEISLRDITRQILESYGYRALTAADGTEALALFMEKRSEVRVVITDMMMPYMDGSATIRALRRIDPHVRVVATSGLMVVEYAREARDIGVQEFLSKPFTADALLKALRRALDSPPAQTKEMR
jgi:CheY-like chemotaxis protein